MEKIKARTKKMEEQLLNNVKAKLAFSSACLELLNENNGLLYNAKSKQLRTCQARVYETDNFYILKSYHTFIAVIRKETGTCFDVLRCNYGYTATSAQHINKFIKDYSNNGFKITYRDV